jgi:colanic acid/amylovoran biosynthesis glycosyltransferase
VRLLYITVSLPFGAAEAFFIPEVHEMRRQGCEVLIVPRSPEATSIHRDAEGFQEFSVPMPLMNARIVAAAFAVILRHPIRVLRAFARILRCRNVATSVRNVIVFPKSLWIAGLARRWGADHIHAQWALTTGTMGMVASEISGIPWSCTAHRGDIVDNNLLAVKLGRAAFVRFIAQDGVAMAESICGRPLPGRTFVLHLGVDLPDRTVSCTEFSSPPVLLCVAYLSERKGHKYLIEAMRLLRESGTEVRLLIAGDGAIRPALEAQVAKCGLGPQVTFLGDVDHAWLLDMLQAGKADLMVLPTLHEGIPVSLIEAMSRGVPVISTSVGGVPELLQGDAGIIVPPSDPEALANAIRRLIADPALRCRLAENGRRRVEEGWAVQPVVAELLKRLQSCGK